MDFKSPLQPISSIFLLMVFLPASNSTARSFRAYISIKIPLLLSKKQVYWICFTANHNFVIFPSLFYDFVFVMVFRKQYIKNYSVTLAEKFVKMFNKLTSYYHLLKKRHQYYSNLFQKNMISQSLSHFNTNENRYAVSDHVIWSCLLCHCTRKLYLLLKWWFLRRAAFTVFIKLVLYLWSNKMQHVLS